MQSDQICLISLYSGMASIGLIGNLLVCFIIQQNRPVKRPINYLFLNLAISDTIVLIFISIKYVLVHLFHHPFGKAGDFLCRFVTGGSIAWVGAVSSVCTMICISFERYYIVLKPWQYLKLFKVANIKKALKFSWIFAIFFNAPLFVFGGFDERARQCTEQFPSRGFYIAYVFIWLSFVAIFPAIIVLVVYSQIIYTLWLKRKGDLSFISRTAIHKARRKVTKVVYIISLIYCVSWFPPLIDNVIIVFASNRLLSDIPHQATVFLVVLNSSVNPLIYTFQSARFRQHLRWLFCKKRGKNIVCPSQGAWVPPLRRQKSNQEPIKELNVTAQDLLFLWLTGP